VPRGPRAAPPGHVPHMCPAAGRLVEGQSRLCE
jgi:hypothetical protein